MRKLLFGRNLVVAHPGAKRDMEEGE